MKPEPRTPVRCWTVDVQALGRCPRLHKRHRLLLGAAVEEEARRAGEHFELMADIAKARASRAAAGLDQPAAPRLVSAPGVVGDLKEALADLPERRSRIRLAGAR